MKIKAKLLTVGKKPEINFLDGGTLMIRMPVAENHNRNEGTRDNPEWVRIGTSWFDMVAFGETAQDIYDNLDQGDAFELISGTHKWKDVSKDEDERDFRPQYVINEFKKYERKD